MTNWISGSRYKRGRSLVLNIAAKNVDTRNIIGKGSIWLYADSQAAEVCREQSCRTGLRNSEDIEHSDYKGNEQAEKLAKKDYMMLRNQQDRQEHFNFQLFQTVYRGTHSEIRCL